VFVVTAAGGAAAAGNSFTAGTAAQQQQHWGMGSMHMHPWRVRGAPSWLGLRLSHRIQGLAPADICVCCQPYLVRMAFWGCSA
jgi:hypothetical protein